MSRVGSYLGKLRRGFTRPAKRAGRIVFCLIVAPLRLFVLLLLLLNAAAHADVGGHEPPPGLSQRPGNLAMGTPSTATPSELRELPSAST